MRMNGGLGCIKEFVIVTSPELDSDRKRRVLGPVEDHKKPNLKNKDTQAGVKPQPSQMATSTLRREDGQMQ